MTDEEMNKIAELVAEKMSPVKEDVPKEEESSKQGQPFSTQELVTSILGALDQRDASSRKEVTDIVWKEKLETTMQSTPGLKEYLESEDDYGQKRIDKLGSVESLEEKSTLLSKMSGSFKEAVANNGGHSPIVDEKTHELAKNNEQRYKEIDDKVSAGEYESVDALKRDVFAAISQEMDSITP